MNTVIQNEKPEEDRKRKREEGTRNERDEIMQKRSVEEEDDDGLKRARNDVETEQSVGGEDSQEQPEQEEAKQREAESGDNMIASTEREELDETGSTGEHVTEIAKENENEEVVNDETSVMDVDDKESGTEVEEGTTTSTDRTAAIKEDGICEDTSIDGTLKQQEEEEEAEEELQVETQKLGEDLEGESLEEELISPTDAEAGGTNQNPDVVMEKEKSISKAPPETNKMNMVALLHDDDDKEEDNAVSSAKLADEAGSYLFSTSCCVLIVLWTDAYCLFVIYSSISLSLSYEFPTFFHGH